jgi:flagellar biosynthesis GTPase FlhF
MRSSRKRRISKRISKRISRKRTSRKRTSRKRTSRKRTSRKRRFGAPIVELDDGTILKKVNEDLKTKEKNLKKLELNQDSVHKYFKTVQKKLIQINEKIKSNGLVMTLGTFLLLIFVLLYTSYDDIKTKSVWELIYNLFTYLFSGSLLSQHAIKDTFYELSAKIKKAFSYDHELEEINEQFKYLQKENLIDTKTASFFRELNNDYLSINNGEQTATTHLDKSNLKSFMKLAIDLNTTRKSEMNTVLSNEDIKNISDRLTEFINDYGTAKKQLDKQIINPLLLSMIGKNGPPISAIFLVGNPGVGKTRFVNELANKINANIYEYIYDKKQGFHRMNTLSKSVKEQYQNLNVFIKMKLESNDEPNKPIILFIDEIDKKLNKELLTELLQLLGDPKSREIKDKALNINVKLPKNLIIVCASNKSLESIVEKNSIYEPLLSRFVEIFIPNMTKDKQYDIAIKYMTGLYPQITDDDKKFIREVINRTKYPGVRDIITISNSYISHLKSIVELHHIKQIESPAEYRENFFNDLTKRTRKRSKGSC